MIVESKYNIDGIAKGKRYHVYDILHDIDAYKIILDNGTIGLISTKVFTVLDDNFPQKSSELTITKMKKCEFCEASSTDGRCKWEKHGMLGSKEAGCKTAIERMMTVIRNQSIKKPEKIK